jgi:hypothetical protein
MNAVSESVMLYLQHDFYKIVFKIKHKSYIASGSAPPRKNSGCAQDGNLMTLLHVTALQSVIDELLILIGSLICNSCFKFYSNHFIFLLDYSTLS